MKIINAFKAISAISIFSLGFWCSNATSKDCGGFNKTWLDDQTLVNYWVTQAQVDHFWKFMGYNNKYWKDNGFQNWRDVNAGVGRAVAASWLLLFGDFNNYPKKTNDFSGDLLHYAFNYVAKHTWDLRYSCDTKLLGYAERHFWDESDDYLIIYKAGMALYPVQRAAVILHEARHLDVGYWGGHLDDCNGGTDNCDYAYGTESTSFFVAGDGYPGAYTYELAWLHQYTQRGFEISPNFTRRMACDQANSVAAHGFKKPPNYFCDNSKFPIKPY